MEQCQRLHGIPDPELSGHPDAAQLAYCLTIPYGSCQESVDVLCEQFSQYHGGDRFRYITTFIVKLADTPEDPRELSRIYSALTEYLSHMHLHMICSEKRLHHLIFHIFGEHPATESTQQMIARKMNSIFEHCTERCIAIGDTVTSISAAYHSYESAVIALQGSFFFEPGSILTARSVDALPQADLTAIQAEVSRYITALNENDEAVLSATLPALSLLVSHHTGLFPNQLKGIYYEMFSALYKMCKAHQLLPDFVLENQDNIMDIMDSCFSFLQLHRILTEKPWPTSGI